MIVLGKYKENAGEKYPSIYDFVSEEEYANKKKIIDYLHNGKEIGIAPAMAKDVITGAKINLTIKLMTDGEYRWRSDLPYYVDKYNLRLPEEFIQHIAKQMGK